MSLRELRQLPEQYLVVGYAFLNETYRALAIDDVSDPSAAEEAADLALFIGDKGKTDLVQLGKFLVGFERIAADAQDLGIELFKAGDIPLKSLQFPRSDRGEVGKVKS